MPQSLLKITTVKIDVDGRRLKNVRLDGRTDIFSDDEVERMTQERDGKITQIEGELTYKGQPFDFVAGYNDQTGRIKIRKKGSPTGDVEILQEAYEFLFELYTQHFIDE